VAALFSRFDPRAFLESEEPRATPAKAANVAKVLDGPVPALASLAALAAYDIDSHDSAAAPEAELPRIFCVSCSAYPAPRHPCDHQNLKNQTLWYGISICRDARSSR
jgi:hypothetical protein